MGKVKERQMDMVEKQQLHGIKNSSIKKNKDSKFKHIPKGKATLINDLKSQGNYAPSQKGSRNAKNQNQNLLKKQTSNSNAKQSKQGSPNGKQKFSSKGQKFNKTKTNPKKMEEQFDDSSSDIDEGIVPQEDVSLNKTDETFEEDSDTDTPDIFGKSLGDESDEDDEDFEEEDEELEDEDEAGAEDEDVEEEEDDDSDEEEVVQDKRIKMFEGLQSKAMNDGDEEDQEEDDDDEDELSDETFGDLALAESDEDDDDDNDEDEDEEDDDDDDEDEDVNNYKKQILSIKTSGEVDSSVMESDEEDEDEDDDEEEEEEDDDSDDDNVDAELGLKALLGKSIADDDDDEDFNEEDEDDEDDDISSEDEDYEENDNAITKAYIMKKEKVTKKKADEVLNKKDVSKGNTKVEKETEQDVKRRLVFVNNIPKGTPINNIKILFGQYGVVKNVDYPLSDCSRNIGKNPKKMAAVGTEVQPRATTVVGNILYKTEESALKAAKELNGTKLNGNYLTVLTALEAKQDVPEAKTVFLTNLKRGVEENEIWKTFGKCGQIKRLRLIRDSRSGLTKGYGYLSFDSKDAVHLALKLNGTEVMGRPLKVLPFRDSKKVHVNESNKKDEKQGTKRFLSHKGDNKPSKKFKNSSQEPVSYNAEHERNVKHTKQQGDNKETKAFQGQKVQLKSKKKNKFDKKKKKMAEKLTAKSAKV